MQRFTLLTLFFLLSSVCISVDAGTSVSTNTKYKYLDLQGTYHDVNVNVNKVFITPKIIYDSVHHNIEVNANQLPAGEFVTFVNSQNIYYLDLNGWIGSFNSNTVEEPTSQPVRNLFNLFTRMCAMIFWVVILVLVIFIEIFFLFVFMIMFMTVFILICSIASESFGEVLQILF